MAAPVSGRSTGEPGHAEYLGMMPLLLDPESVLGTWKNRKTHQIGKCDCSFSYFSRNDRKEAKSV